MTTGERRHRPAENLDTIATLCAECDGYWPCETSWREKLRAERENLIWRNRLLRQRPDLPADRIGAHDEMVRLQAEVERLREAEENALRVLYHVISSNKHFDDFRPNELTDDAIRVGHEFLVERGWTEAKI